MTRSWSCIIAIAAGIAVAGCNSGVTKSEAQTNLEKMGAALKAKFDRVGAFPTGRVGPTPPITCCSQPDKECGNDATAWQLPLWTEIGFSVSGKHKFVYTYEGTPTGFTATAVGDLDCDTTSVTYTLTGTASGKTVTQKLEKPTLID
jgi:hypothetical protein